MGRFQELRSSAILNQIRSRAKGRSGRTTRNSLSRSPSLARERGSDEGKGSGSARAMEKETRINSR